MANVPEARALTASPTASARSLQSLTAPALAFGSTVAAEGLGALATAAQGTSDSLSDHALQMQAVNNKVAADQSAIAYTSAADKIALEYKNNHVGMAAYDNLDKVYVELESARTKAAEGLTPNAQLAYNSASRSQLAYAQSQLRDFAVTQRKASLVNTSAAKIDTLRAQAAGDPAFTPQAVEQIAGEWAWRMRPDVMGLTEEQARAGMTKDIGSIYAGQVRVAVDKGDYPAAQAAFDAHRADMTAEQIDSVSGALKVGQNAFVANGWADEFIDGHARGPVASAGASASAPAPKSNSAIISALHAAAPGSTINSTVRTPAHNAEVGGVANSQHLASRGGTAVDFGPAKGQTVAELADKLRAVGIGKVIPEPAKNHVHVQWGGTSATKTPHAIPFTAHTDPDQYIADSYAAIEAQAKHDFPSNPTLQAQAESAARSRVNVRAAQLRASQSATYDRLATAVLRGDIQDSSALAHAYPGAAQDLVALPPSHARALEADMHRNSNEVTPERAENIVTLRGMRDQAPQAFATADLTKLDLPTSTRLSLMQQQKDTAAKLAAQGAKATQLDTATKQALNTVQAKAALASLGLKGDERSAAYYNFAGALADALDNYTTIHGKPPVAGSKEMSGIVSQVTATVGVKKGSWFFGLGADPGHPAFQVPDDFRNSITAAASARGQLLTEYQIGQLYRRSLSAR